MQFSPTLSELTKPLLSAQKIIWFAITGSVIIFVAVAFITTQNKPAGPPAPALGEIELILGALAAVMALAAAFYRKTALSDEKLKAILNQEVTLEVLARDPKSKQIDGDLLQKLQTLNTKEQKIFHLVERSARAFVVSLALNEAVTLFGLALALIKGNAFIIIPFALVSLVLNFLAFPKPETMLERADGWLLGLP